MSWNNSGPYPQDQGYYAGQPGYPPPGQPGPYPPPPGSYPPPGGYPGGAPGGGFPGGPPGAGYPGAPPAAGFGFHPPPPQQSMYGGANPYNDANAGYGAGYDDGDPEVKGFDFSDASVRRGFIRKVYSILMVQLSITTAFIAWFLFHRPTREFVQRTPALFIIALVMIFVCLIAMACCGELRRKAPTNFIFLFIFTVAESFVMGVSASMYKQDAVLMAAGITAVVCLGLTLFAFQTKWDFTMMGGILFVAVLILMVFGIVMIFWHNKVAQMAYASLGALIFSIYLVYDTQLMLGGKHKYSISPEEYIFAALNLYLDIINIFIYILSIIGNARD